MATTFTTYAKLGCPADADLAWGDTLRNDLYAPLDVIKPLTGLMVTTHEVPSSSLTVDIAPGTFVTQDGTVHTYAGTTGYSIPTGTTKVVFLDGTAAWVLTTGASYPTSPHVRLATVVAGATTITSVTDNRQSFAPSGFWYDGLVINVGTSTGLQLGSAAAQKIGLWGSTPVVQPSGAAQTAMTDSTGGVVGTTLAACLDTSTGDRSAVLNANFASLNNLVAAIRTALVNIGAIKGSA